ncbi:MAG: Kef-type potassium/proton antiporter accessory [Prolixibacteraceae bacterium]|nr:MAG: Kef-type potassium/proton antiporter accessory [Prolixibacteraceae bacterium]
MKKILIIFAHPAINKSRIHRRLTDSVKNMPGISLNNLYEKYPDFYIDIIQEQQLLIEHDIIVWQHPFYWFSAPAILKEWFDLVLQHGFAYGEKGHSLEGKQVLSVISTGGNNDVYSKKGRNHYTINEFLVPFKQSASLCRMEYLPPYVIFGSHTITPAEIEVQTSKYKKMLTSLRDNQWGCLLLQSVEYLNELTN